jgi:HAD superfamily hydrolase (TIGR01509 family)
MRISANGVPYRDIDTVFLDVGNTLISMDFDWIAAELAARGVAADAELLRRAEAGARPGYSRRLFIEGLPPGTDVFRVLLVAMMGRVPEAARLAPAAFERLIDELRQVLRPDGRASVLWRSVMPRVPEALCRLQALGLRLVVVSNSDGTAEQSLEAAGLRPYLTQVIDSALVGFEKPDPRIFTHALTITEAEAARTLHVGDLYHADVSGARGAGVHVVLLDPHGDWVDVDCDRARDLLDVADRLEGS